MYSKWEIPEDVCNNRPIGPNDLDKYVGHKELTKEVLTLLD